MQPVPANQPRPSAQPGKDALKLPGTGPEAQVPKELLDLTRKLEELSAELTAAAAGHKDLTQGYSKLKTAYYNRHSLRRDSVDEAIEEGEKLRGAHKKLDTLYAEYRAATDQFNKLLPAFAKHKDAVKELKTKHTEAVKAWDTLRRVQNGTAPIDRFSPQLLDQFIAYRDTQFKAEGAKVKEHTTTSKQHTTALEKRAGELRQLTVDMKLFWEECAVLSEKGGITPADQKRLEERFRVLASRREYLERTSQSAATASDRHLKITGEAINPESKFSLFKENRGAVKDQRTNQIYAHANLDTERTRLKSFAKEYDKFVRIDTLTSVRSRYADFATEIKTLRDKSAAVAAQLSSFVDDEQGTVGRGDKAIPVAQLYDLAGGKVYPAKVAPVVSEYNKLKAELKELREQSLVLVAKEKEYTRFRKDAEKANAAAVPVLLAAEAKKIDEEMARLRAEIESLDKQAKTLQRLEFPLNNLAAKYVAAATAKP